MIEGEENHLRLALPAPVMFMPMTNPAFEVIPNGAMFSVLQRMLSPRHGDHAASAGNPGIPVGRLRRTRFEQAADWRGPATDHLRGLCCAAAWPKKAWQRKSRTGARPVARGGGRLRRGTGKTDRGLSPSRNSRAGIHSSTANSRAI